MKNKKTNNKKYDFKVKEDAYTCGDGCCYEEYICLFVNGIKEEYETHDDAYNRDMQYVPIMKDCNFSDITDALEYIMINYYNINIKYIYTESFDDMVLDEKNLTDKYNTEFIIEEVIEPVDKNKDISEIAREFYVMKKFDKTINDFDYIQDENGKYIEFDYTDDCLIYIIEKIYKDTFSSSYKFNDMSSYD